MFQRVLTTTIAGIQAVPVQVEADVSDGLPGFLMIGYLSSQAREAQDRVRTALRNIELPLPPKKITVNLAPGDIRKDGARFDLPIAMALLAAVEKIPASKLGQVMMVGELSLNGHVRGVAGVLPTVLSARDMGCTLAVVPKDNLQEAQVVEGIEVVGMSHLSQAVLFFQNGTLPDQSHEGTNLEEEESIPDFADVYGQTTAKRACLISAAGFHNLLFLGPPGAGKTMLAKRIPGILPPPSKEEQLEMSRIYSIAGLLSPERPLMRHRPFRSPHHTVSSPAMAGGGLIPRPGEITLAHRGVLFLDEMPEFRRETLEILRQPLEDRMVQISRSNGTYYFPAHFLLLAAMNPCPCGYYPDLNRCTCQPSQISRYIGKISQPLLDRMDLCVETKQVTYEQLAVPKKDAVTSAMLRSQVEQAVVLQKERFYNEGILFNSEMKTDHITKYCPMTKEGERLLHRAFQSMKISARGYHRILKVARTVADLDKEEKIGSTHVGEAISYRSIEKEYWRI